jgi:hypothetical protein
MKYCLLFTRKLRNNIQFNWIKRINYKFDCSVDHLFILLLYFTLKTCIRPLQFIFESCNIFWNIRIKAIMFFLPVFINN